MTPEERKQFAALRRHMSLVTALLDDVFDCVPVQVDERGNTDKEFNALERKVFRARDRTKELLAVGGE